jgi:TRAP-type C4-dicarboxylate transport system permease small subunit
MRYFLARMVDLLMIILALFVMRYGLSLCQVTWDQYIAEFPVLRVGFTYLPLPIGSLITLIFVLESLAFGSQHRRKVVMIGSHCGDDDTNP